MAKKKEKKSREPHVDPNYIREMFGLGKIEDEPVRESDWGTRDEKTQMRINKNNKKNYMGKNKYTGNARGGNGHGNNNRRENTTVDIASAPYNFVSLPSEVLTAQFEIDLQGKNVSSQYGEYIKEKGKNSGYFDVTLITKTPCFIGGNSENKEKFFSPNGQVMIPGSSLRGMVKNIFKIVTCGAMRPDEDITDKHLYFRGLAAKGKFGDYYKNRMSVINKETKKTESKAKAGFLIKLNNDKYYICPADYKKEEYKNQPKKESCIDYYCEKQEADIHTGAMRWKNHYYHIENCTWDEDKRIEVPGYVINDYQNDATRKGFNLLGDKNVLKKEKASGFCHIHNVVLVVPCFYLAQDGVAVHFGQGPYYRIPYEKAISEHIPDVVKGGEYS